MQNPWNKEQWKVMMTLVMTHLSNGMCVALQAPFYPAEAEKKGASATSYGLVFGIFELTVFLVSPFMGKFLPRIGVGSAFNGGITITGLMCIAFGFLDRVSGGDVFIGLSLANRIVAGVGNSAFLSASFTLVAQVFPNTVSTIFGVVEMAFGVGMIIGPTVGGVLYQLGGFEVPFAVLGGVLLCQAAVSSLTLPRLKMNTSDTNQTGGLGAMEAFKIPSVVLATFSVFSASISVGALQATLERHLVNFDLSTMHVGMIFMLYGGAYALLNPLWGWMADKVSSKLVIMVGSFLLSLGFLLVGPVPGMGIDPSYSLCIVSVILAGLGLGAQLVASFSEAMNSALSRGFPDNLTTYAMVSSIWTSAFALGAFVGPTAAGALCDFVGFRWSTLFTLSWNSLVCLAAFISLVAMWIDSTNTMDRSLYKELDGSNIDKVDEGYRSDNYRESFSPSVSKLNYSQTFFPRSLP